MAFGTEPLDASLIPISSVYSKENNAFPALAGEPGAYLDSNSNQSSVVVMSFLRPLIVQKAHSSTGSGGKTLTCAFGSNNIAGNSIVVCVGMGEVEGANITLTVTDTLSNTYTEAVSASQSTTLEAAIFYATNIASGANTVTITIAGSSSTNTAIAVQIYEVFGLIAEAGALDATATGNNAGSTSVSTSAVTPVVPNEYVFMAVSAAGGTITVASPWTLDSGSLSPTGGNLVSFGAQSRPRSQIVSLTPAATLSTSNAWAAACATFKSVIVPIEGSVNVMQIGGQTPKLDNTNELGVSVYGKNSTAGDTALGLDSSGRVTSIIQAVGGTALAADQTNSELRVSLYGKSSAAGDTALIVDSSGVQYIRGNFVEQASLSAGSLNADLVASTDVSAYKWWSLHINNTAYSGTLTFQCSNDNSNWTSQMAYDLSAGSAFGTTTTTSTNKVYAAPVMFRYMRVRMTSYSSGTAQGTLELYTMPTAFPTLMPFSSTGTLTSVAGTTSSSTQLLAANTSRRGVYIFNDSTATLYVGFNATVTTSSYTVQVPSNGFFEMPTAPIYTGIIAGVWSAAAGNARITELS